MNEYKSNTDRVWEAMQNMIDGDGHFRMVTTYGEQIDLVLLPGDEPDQIIVRDASQTIDGRAEVVPQQMALLPPTAGGAVSSRPRPRPRHPRPPAPRPAPRPRVLLSAILAILATLAALILAVVIGKIDLSPDPSIHCDLPPFTFNEGGQCQVSWLYVHQSAITGTGTCKNGEYDCIRLTSRDAAPDWVLAMENWSNVDPVAEWPWPYIEGEILREPMPNWQLSLELLACGNHKTTWPRTCYTSFTQGLVTRVLFCISFSWVVFVLLFLLLDRTRS